MTDPTPTPPELDRISHNHGPEDGGGMACRTHPTGDCVIRALTARAEAAEAKIAAVREVVVRDAGYEYTYGGDVILVELVTAALDGTA